MQAVGGQTRARAARPENGIASSRSDTALRCRSYEHPAHAQVTGRTHAAAESCETFAVQCIVLQRDTRQGKPQPQHGAQHERTLALHHRSAGGQPTLQPTGKPPVSNAECRVAGCALGCIQPCAGLQCTRCNCVLSDTRSEKHPLPHDAQIHPRVQGAATRKSPPCWQTSALPSAGPGDTAATIQRTQREASTSTVARAHVAATCSVTTQPPAA